MPLKSVVASYEAGIVLTIQATDCKSFIFKKEQSSIVKELEDHVETFENEVFFIFDKRRDDIEDFLAVCKPSINLRDRKVKYVFFAYYLE